MPPAVCHLVRRNSSDIKFDRAEITFTSALFFGLKKKLTNEECFPCVLFTNLILLLLRFPAITLRLTILGEIFARVTDF